MTEPPQADGLADYYQRANPDLLRLLPADARVLLEFGCGAGALGAAYRHINPAARYLGVEMNPAAAQAAETVMDRVWLADAEAFSPATPGAPAAGSVDCLVYGDVLEHLRDPWAALQSHAAWLKEDGMVIACIPNIQHWSAILELLQGRWRYEDHGVLDRTHLRFFTREGMVQLFGQAGLHVVDIESRQLRPEGFDAFQEAMAPALQALGLDAARFRAQTGAVQYIVRATRHPLSTRRLLIEGVTLRPQVAMLEKRMLEPGRFLATLPGVRVRMGQGRTRASRERPGEDRVIILQRQSMVGRPGAEKLKSLLAGGYVVVQEFDDDPHRWPHHFTAEDLSFRGVHAVQTSTETLAEILRAANPEVGVFANQMAELPPPRIHAEGPPRLFFGALNRQEDWAPLMPELNRVLAEHPEVAVAVIHDRAFFDQLATANKDFTPACDYPRYQAILRGCDIALLPLSDTPFNRCKSDVKFIECAAHGAAVLASPVVYAASIRPGETGLLFDDPQAFGRALRQLIEDAGLRRRLAGEAYEYVKRERLQAQHYRERYQWYRRLVEEKPRLDRELRQRAPELFG